MKSESPSPRKSGAGRGKSSVSYPSPPHGVDGSYELAFSPLAKRSRNSPSRPDSGAR